MAQTYSLQMESDAGEEYVRSLVLANGGFVRNGDTLHRPGVSVFVKLRDPSTPSYDYFRRVSSEDFGITPDIGVTFQIDKFEHTRDGMRVAVGVAASISRAVSFEARLWYYDDHVVFVRRNGTLVLDQTWVEGNPLLVAEITESHTVEDLRAQDVQRAAAAEAASLAAGRSSTA